MRPDIKVGATFPDYEFTDHARRRKGCPNCRETTP
jgi:hypothetical protein